MNMCAITTVGTVQPLFSSVNYCLSGRLCGRRGAELVRPFRNRLAAGRQIRNAQPDVRTAGHHASHVPGPEHPGRRSAVLDRRGPADGGVHPGGGDGSGRPGYGRPPIAGRGPEKEVPGEDGQQEGMATGQGLAPDGRLGPDDVGPDRHGGRVRRELEHVRIRAALAAEERHVRVQRAPEERDHYVGRDVTATTVASAPKAVLSLGRVGTYTAFHEISRHEITGYFVMRKNTR